MVRVAGVVAAFKLLQVGEQLGGAQRVVLNEATDLVEVQGQQGECPARRGIRKSKDVKLPVAFCIL